MKEVYKLTAVMKEMEVKLNMKLDGIENDDRERVVNTVTQKEQSCDTETEQRRLTGGKVTGIRGRNRGNPRSGLLETWLNYKR